MRTLLDTIETAEAVISTAPKFDDGDLSDYEAWFIRHTRYFRGMIADMIMRHGGCYAGEVGNHMLELNGVHVIRADGFRSLLADWAMTARAVLAARQAGE